MSAPNNVPHDNWSKSVLIIVGATLLLGIIAVSITITVSGAEAGQAVVGFLTSAVMPVVTILVVGGKVKTQLDAAHHKIEETQGKIEENSSVLQDQNATLAEQTAAIADIQEQTAHTIPEQMRSIVEMSELVPTQVRKRNEPPSTSGVLSPR